MTKKSFEELKKLFNDNRFNEIENDLRGIRFLKLRSISRKETIIEIAEQNGLETKIIQDGKKKDKKAEILFKEVFESTKITENIIDNYILDKYKIERSERKKEEDELINEMYKLEIFDWGGSNGNSLEKNIVNNYVKK